ncbi:MAG TPA: winged helix-turn-helix domain-containing protein [Candidatus Saccharimonadales bacterium]|nr:winged helix-turn-helix domain-containing protein [Candidatus Saccharimonadales bacterium]
MDKPQQSPEHDPVYPTDTSAAIFIGKIGSREVVEIAPISFIVAPDGSVGVIAKQLSQLFSKLEPNGVLWIRNSINGTNSSETQLEAKVDEQMSFLEGRIRIDTNRRELSVDDVIQTTTRKEFDILSFLASRAGRIVNRDEILLACWGDTWRHQRSVDVQVCHIRDKLGDVNHVLKTVRGAGYIFDDRTDDKTT